MHIILIARHYPPEVTGGARRPSLLTRALRGLGHRVTLVTPFQNADFEDHLYVPHPIQHIGNPLSSTKPQSLSLKMKIRTLLRQWLLWPDPEIRWASRVKAELLAANYQPDWVMTTSPPESLHVIGSEVAKSFGCHWITECRDTWFLNPHRDILEASALRRFFERRIARKAFARLTAVTAVSEAVMNDIRSVIPAQTPELLIGHFSTALPDDKKVEGRIKLPRKDINLVHSGGFSLSDRRRKLEPLLQALKRSKRTDLHLHIAGRLTEKERELSMANYPFKVSLHGQVTLEQSQALQTDADALLLITPDESHALPGKYAEYLLAGRPILFSGGGDWLSLVDDVSTLSPLELGLETVKKASERSVIPASALTHEDAAKKLVKFLENI